MSLWYAAVSVQFSIIKGLPSGVGFQLQMASPSCDLPILAPRKSIKTLNSHQNPSEANEKIRGH